MTELKYSRWKWIGLALVFVGLGFTPLMLLVFGITRPSVDVQDCEMVTAGLIALSSGALSAGVGILALEHRFAQQRSDDHLN
jgi:hypothetical protein